MIKSKGISLASRGLRYKLKIAVSLMAILPLLVCVYIVSSYVLPLVGFKVDVLASVGMVVVSITIAVIGFTVVKEVFDHVLTVSTEAKLIAAGDLSRKVEVPHEDELGDLGDALNQMTVRIRSNMDELKSYSERTTEINMEIQKRVIVLSSLLQISSLISQGARLDDILKITVEKARLLANSEMAFLLFREENSDTFFAKVTDGLNLQHLNKVRIPVAHRVFGKLVTTNLPLVVDKKNRLSPDDEAAFREEFKVKNVLALGVHLKGKVLGILAIANSQEGFTYDKDDVELLDIFAKQVAIGVENDFLLHRIEKLEIKDALTGLYNEMFIRSRLQEEIKRAIVYQRPCAFALLNVDNFEKFHRTFGLLRSESTLKKVASLVRDSVSEIDRVARFGDNDFAIVLPEKNKRQALDLTEEIRRRIEVTFSSEQDPTCRITVSGGISENPLDGVESEELIAKAKASLAIAKSQGKNRVVV